DAAVALPVAPALALAALLFAFPRDRLRIPVLIAQAQDADLRRVLDRPRVHAPIQRHTLLARRDRRLDGLVGPLGGGLLLAALVVEAARPEDREAVLDGHAAVRVADQPARAGPPAVLTDDDRRTSH